MMMIDDHILADPADLIPDAAFRQAVDERMTELMTAADPIIASLVNEHFGQLTPPDMEAAIAAVRRYGVARMQQQEACI